MFRLPSGRRIDGLNIKKLEIRELRLNNPRAIRDGERQLKKYIKELEKMYPGTKGKWKSKVVTY